MPVEYVWLSSKQVIGEKTFFKNPFEQKLGNTIIIFSLSMFIRILENTVELAVGEFGVGRCWEGARGKDRRVQEKRDLKKECLSNERC